MNSFAAETPGFWIIMVIMMNLDPVSSFDLFILCILKKHGGQTQTHSGPINEDLEKVNKVDNPGHKKITLNTYKTTF